MDTIGTEQFTSSFFQIIGLLSGFLLTQLAIIMFGLNAGEYMDFMFYFLNIASIFLYMTKIDIVLTIILFSSLSSLVVFHTIYTHHKEYQILQEIANFRARYTQKYAVKLLNFAYLYLLVAIKIMIVSLNVYKTKMYIVFTESLGMFLYFLFRIVWLISFIKNYHRRVNNNASPLTMLDIFKLQFKHFID